MDIQKEACPSGQASESGFQPGCVPISFDFSKLNKTATIKPVTGTSDPKANIDQVTFKCSLSCPTDSDCAKLNGSVYWYIDGSILYNTSLSYSSSAKELYSYLAESVWGNHLNKKVFLYWSLYY